MPMQPKKVTNFSLQNNSLDGTLNSNSFEDTLTSHYQVIVKFSSTQAGINGILGPDRLILGPCGPWIPEPRIYDLVFGLSFVE